MIVQCLRPAALCCLILFLSLLTACASEPDSLPPPATLTPYPPDHYIGLSDSAASLADLVSDAYEAASGRPAPIFLAGSDQALLNDLQQGVLEAAIMHHLPADTQLWFNPVALDGVVIITNPDIKVDDLSAAQIQAIFGGTIDNWAGVGGPDLPVNLFSRESGAGAWDILSERLMENVPLSGLARIAPTDEFMRSQVAAVPGAIGYAMMGSAGDDALLLEGHTATPDTVADQSYPLTAPLYFVTQTEPEGALRDFLAWLQSPAGQAILSEKYGRVR